MVTPSPTQSITFKWRVIEWYPTLGKRQGRLGILALAERHLEDKSDGTKKEQGKEG